SRWQPGAGDMWSAVIQQMAHANLAQAPEWWSVIQNVYGHTPLYMQAEDATGQVACLPAFLVRSRWFGTLDSGRETLVGRQPALLRLLPACTKVCVHRHSG